MIRRNIFHGFYKNYMNFFRNLTFRPEFQLNTNINIQSKPVRFFILLHQRTRWNQLSFNQFTIALPKSTHKFFN